ncbi:hypothetical protein LZ31DRAFT_215906 [Colletotrichum somersetense]|nr:hypothetical protein LZ31DRAFT_215906 [Colletotrichum somersetense]
MLVLVPLLPPFTHTHTHTHSASSADSATTVRLMDEAPQPTLTTAAHHSRRRGGLTRQAKKPLPAQSNDESVPKGEGSPCPVPTDDMSPRAVMNVRHRDCLVKHVCAKKKRRKKKNNSKAISDMQRPNMASLSCRW